MDGVPLPRVVLWCQSQIVPGCQHGGVPPLEQTTAGPDGTTMVVVLLGGAGSLLLKLKQPLSARGSNTTNR